MDDTALPELLRMLRRLRAVARRRKQPMPECCQAKIADILAVTLDAYEYGNLGELAAGVWLMGEDFEARAASPWN